VNRYLTILLLLNTILQAKSPLPKGFCYIKAEIPSVVLEIRYATQNNFIGEPIHGYLAPKAILTTQATQALKAVQEELHPFGLGLKIFDAYRPQKAVDHFVQWGKDLHDTRMKSLYYPTVEKKDLFRLGYIAKRSGHSRGSTVDLTLIDLNTTQELDMGSMFDLFSPQSGVYQANLTAQQRANRMLLHQVMVQHGFKALKEEWWHFTLSNEPYKKRYFDFDVQ